MKEFKTLFIVMLSGLFFFGCNTNADQEKDTSEEVADATEYIDAIEAASEYYKLISEDGPVRVIEMILPAGVRDNVHSHKNETVYFINGGNASIYVGEDTVMAELPDGHVMHHAPWTHSVENTGKEAIHALIFERMELDTVEPMDNFIDPTVASPEHYQLLSKEGNVRLIHMTLAPGETDELHSHYYEAAYFLSGGKVNIHAGEEVMEADIPDGHVLHHEPWTHQVENVGETTIEAIIFERLPAGME